MDSSVYLVVEPIQVIATDLAMNIREYDPSATVLLARSPDAACDVIAGEPSVRLAFVHVDARTFCRSDLARALDRRGAQVVFAGSRAEQDHCGKLVLDWPFSAESTAALLQRAEQIEAA